MSCTDLHISPAVVMWSGRPPRRPPRRPPLSSVPVGANHQPHQQHDSCTEGGRASQADSVPDDVAHGARQFPRFLNSHPNFKGDENGKTTSLQESTVAPDEVYIKSWLSLPSSQYCIHYELGSAKTSLSNILGSTSSSSSVKEGDGISMLQLVASKSPFELKMQELNTVLQGRYPHGAGLVYVREFLEPGDPDFPHARNNGRGGGDINGDGAIATGNKSDAQCQVVHVSTLSREQVGRLRLLIVDDKRRAVLISTLRFYSMLPYNGQSGVVDHFESFKSMYTKTRDHRKKLDGLLAVTLALRKYSGWMYILDRGLGRSKMVESLATRWKNLLSTRTPEELGLDTEFSYPAVLTLLQDFKRTVESAPTYGDPKMLFKYEPPPAEGT